MWSLSEVAKHNTAESCWIVINNSVYDLTDFLSAHPGGPEIILKYAGKDATIVYEPIHPPNALTDNLPPSKRLGPVDVGSARVLNEQRMQRSKTTDEKRVEAALAKRPPIERIISLADLEVG
jgi:L-lactate dehydrogenase (cytochrome)